MLEQCEVLKDRLLQAISLDAKSPSLLTIVDIVGHRCVPCPLSQLFRGELAVLYTLASPNNCPERYPDPTKPIEV